MLINCVCGIGSTGKLCGTIAREYEARGFEVRIAFGRDGTVPEAYRRYAVRIGGPVSVRLHGVKSLLADAHGLGSAGPTRRFLRWAEAYRPDVLWLHNLHGYYIHYGLLFDWIKAHPELEVRWTLHDCWAFTGHCTHFTMAGCEQWRTRCQHCPERRRYPASLLLDRCGRNFDRKRAAFTGVKDMTLIAPSRWLAGLIRQSFLGRYPVEIHYNALDPDVFRPTPGDFRERHGLRDRFIVLGVANLWDDRKGLADFFRLAERLDGRCTVVLVGLSEKQLRRAPDEIVGIPRTQDQRALAEIYTAADVYVNLSREETFGMTIAEAEACGCPAITYAAGGCGETLTNRSSCIVPVGDLDAVVQRIREMSGQG